MSMRFRELLSNYENRLCKTIKLPELLFKLHNEKNSKFVEVSVYKAFTVILAIYLFILTLECKNIRFPKIEFNSLM